MKEHLSEAIDYGTVKMTAENHPGVILVVEGEDDRFILQRHVSQRVIIITTNGGKPAALRVAESASRGGLKNVLFLVDRDHEHDNGRKTEVRNNVVRSTNHDLVMDLVVTSGTLIDRLIESHARKATRGRTEIDGAAVRKRATELAARIGLLRRANDRNGLGANFSRIPVGSLAPDSSLGDIATHACRGTGVSQESLFAAVEALEDASEIELVGDHDFFRAVARQLATSGVAVGSETLVAGFYAAVTCEHLLRSDWHNAISLWGQSLNCDTFECPCAV